MSQKGQKLSRSIEWIASCRGSIVYMAGVAGETLLTLQCTLLPPCESCSFPRAGSGGSHCAHCTHCAHFL